jgi:hypothetical protein
MKNLEGNSTLSGRSPDQVYAVSISAGSRRAQAFGQKSFTYGAPILSDQTGFYLESTKYDFIKYTTDPSMIISKEYLALSRRLKETSREQWLS